MAEIVYKFEEMENAANNVEGIMGRYVSAASTFVDDFTGAVGAWEGESKEKMMSFITGAVNEYMAKTVPDMLQSLANLLRENAKQMQTADQQIAENIPQSLG